MSAPERIWAEIYFWPNVRKLEDCWEWTATKMGRGYGAIRPSRGAKATGAHRFSWALHNRRWPDKGLVVMHSCDNPACVNPAHLSVGTQSENISQCVERGRHKPFSPPRRERCRSGHLYTDENTVWIKSRGSDVRRCKTCKKEAYRKWHEKNRDRLAKMARDRRSGA